MPNKVVGDLTGLSAKEIRELEEICKFSNGKEDLINPELAKAIYAQSELLHRKLAILIKRNGEILNLVVGKGDLVYLPDFGRLRISKDSLRQVRLIQTNISEKSPATIPSDIITDLEKLRLDCAASLFQENDQLLLRWAWLEPLEKKIRVQISTETFNVDDQFLNFSAWVTEQERMLKPYLAQVSKIFKDKALLICVGEQSSIKSQSRLFELKELARTAGVEIAGEFIQKRQADPKTLVGRGKLVEISLEALRHDANLLIFDRELTPGQWRNITKETDLRIIDRSMLILDIFAMRAKSSDGKLQVELAQLKYNLPRLVDFDSGLSRLSGGIGGRGPGETKLELNRRFYRNRILELEKRIDKLGNQRELRRQKRESIPVPLIALVGYTNVGKSTLFNALCKADVFVENKLFATLDPTQRKLFLPDPREESLKDYQLRQDLGVVLIDTVGFIRELPDELKQAFRATLEEIGQANLLLHIHDASDPAWPEYKQAVENQLSEAGFGTIRKIDIFNKIDLLPEGEILESNEAYPEGAIQVSAASKVNLEKVREKIWQILKKHL